MSRQAAVLGSPISHSLSPALHRAAYAELGLDWTYSAVDLGVEALPGFVQRMDDSWIGLSLTMPLKEAILDLAAEVSRTARETASANTFLWPSRAAHNTDVDGIVVALRRAGFDAPTGFTLCVLGGGATARSAIAAGARLGAANIDILARRPEAADPARRTAAHAGIPISVHRFDAISPLRADLVISTVPAGVADDRSQAVSDNPGWLLDVVYSPWPTPLAQAWLDRGGVIVPGLEMLLAQAERQIELMTGHPAPTEAMRRVLPALGTGSG